MLREILRSRKYDGGNSWQLLDRCRSWIDQSIPSLEDERPPRRQSIHRRLGCPVLASWCLHQASKDATRAIPFKLTGFPLTKRCTIMLWTIFIILLVLWALGLATGATLNGFIHILLVVAIVVVLLRVIQGRRIA